MTDLRGLARRRSCRPASRPVVGVVGPSVRVVVDRPSRRAALDDDRRDVDRQCIDAAPSSNESGSTVQRAVILTIGSPSVVARDELAALSILMLRPRSAGQLGLPAHRACPHVPCSRPHVVAGRCARDHERQRHHDADQPETEHRPSRVFHASGPYPFLSCVRHAGRTADAAGATTGTLGRIVCPIRGSALPRTGSPSPPEAAGNSLRGAPIASRDASPACCSCSLAAVPWSRSAAAVVVELRRVRRPCPLCCPSRSRPLLPDLAMSPLVDVVRRRIRRKRRLRPVHSGGRKRRRGLVHRPRRAGRRRGRWRVSQRFDEARRLDERVRDEGRRSSGAVTAMTTGTSTSARPIG